MSKYFDGDKLSGYEKSPKTTIFGEENFFDLSMITLKYNNAVEKYVYDEFSDAIKIAFPNVIINKEKLERWVKLCLHLENIEDKDLKDIAVKKKIEDLKSQLALTEKALEKSYEHLKKYSTPADWLYHISKEEYIKEMMKSEN